MPTIKELGQKVKAKYPEYRDMSDLEVGYKVKDRFPGAYDDYVEIESKRLLNQAEVEINRHIQPDYSTSFLFYGVAGVMFLISVYLFYNANTFVGYKIFAAFVGSIVLFVISINFFRMAGKARGEALKNAEAEHEFSVKQINSKFALAQQHEHLTKVILNRPVEEEERQTKIAEQQRQRVLMMGQLRNELAVLNAASLQNLDPQTYQEIRRMQAEAEIELQKKAEGYKLDIFYTGELKKIEHEATQALRELDVAMANIKLLLPFHEVSVLNKELAALSLQLEEAEKLPDSHYKQREITRIKNQMKTWNQKINQRQKQLR
jgi:hypothetical protein